MLSTKTKILSFFVLFLTVSGIDFSKKTQIPLTGFTPDVVQYSPDQNFLVALDKDGHAFKIYDGHSLQEIQSVRLADTIDPQAAEFSHDSRFFAMGDNQGNVYIYGRAGKAFTDTPIDTQMVANNSGILSIAFSNDDKKLAVGDFDGIVNIFDFPTEQDALMIQQYGYLFAVQKVDLGSKVEGLSFTPSGDLLAGGGDNQVNGVMKLYSGSNNWLVLKDFKPSQIVQSVAVSFDGSFFLSTGEPPLTGGNAQITVWNGQTFNNASTLPLSGTVGALYEVIISDNMLYAVAAGNKKAYSWQRNATIASFVENPTIDSGIDNIALSPKGGMLLVIPPGNNQIVEYSLCASSKTFYQSSSNNCNSCSPNCNDCFGTNQSQCLQCQPGFYNQNRDCMTCLTGCLTCIDGVSCSTCIPKYFKNGAICTKCIDGCLVCSTTGSCDTCDTNGNWSKTGNVCQCKSGFFDQGEICTACILGCLSCTDTATCQTCDIAKGFTKQGNICACPQKTRLNVDKCQACGLGCLACNETQCSNCDAKEHFIPQVPVDANCQCDDPKNWILGPSNVCICRNRYFENKNEQCQLCRGECTLCLSRNNCTACDNTFVGIDPIVQDGRCLCQDRARFIDIGNKVCVLCSDSVQFCIRCDGPNLCTLCDPNLNRTLKNGVCGCANKYFLNSTTNTCDPCGIDGCLQCSSSTNCTNCDQDANWVDDPSGKCLCRVRYLNVGGVCQDCQRGCLQCTPTVEKCVECDKAANFNDTNQDFRCECIEGTYDNGVLNCLDCEYGCKSCADKNDCNTCFPDFTLKNGDCFCSTGRYKLNRTDCADCTLVGCQDCSSATVCTTCLTDYKLNGFSQCECTDDKKYPDGTKCTPCVQPCLACKNKDTCTSCIEGYTFEDGVCNEDGISVLLIVLIVVGVLALAGAGFAVIKYVKKKKSPLEEQGEYEPIE